MSKFYKKKDSSISNFFITDQALKSAEFDEFGHVDYACLLEKLIWEQPTPFNIGIFGRWGVGKSTIVNLLKERLEVDRKKGHIKIIEVKVWKYDEISLKRKFIVKIAEGLGLEKDLDEINRDIYYDKEFETALLNFKDILSTVFNKRSIALWGIIISLVLLLLFRIVNIIDVENTYWNTLFEKVEEIIIIPVFFFICWWVIEVIGKAKIKLKLSKYDSDEQFENEFIKLIKKEPCKKVIFVDDLDRCSKEKVVRTLETIKTFLDVETCIFIIACDDEIIIDAINRTYELYNIHGRNEGAEYLEKFFQHTVNIPPFMIPDMRKYIATLLKRNNSELLKLNQTLEDILFILINKDIKSPRNAITILNCFSMGYLLAKDREDDLNSKLHNKIITKNLPVLAIVTRIKYHFPAFYEDLLKNNDLIFWLVDISEGNKDKLTEKQLEYCEKYFLKSNETYQDDPSEIHNEDKSALKYQIDWDRPINKETERLFQFLESVKTNLTVKNISEFLFLGIDSTSYLIGDENLQEFNDSLRNGLDSRIEKILGSADETNREYLFDHICDWIQDHLEGVEKRKALQSLSKQFDKCPTSRLFKVSKAFASFYNPKMTFDEFKQYHPSGLFCCAKYIDITKSDNLLSKMIGFLNLNDNEFNKAVLNEAFKNESIIVDQRLIKSLKECLDRRIPITSESSVEKSTSIDFEYVKSKIFEFKDVPQVLIKFFSGNVIEEVLDYLIESDLMDSAPDNEKYKEAEQLFEVLKNNVLIRDISRLCSCYKKLIETSYYYIDLLEDIETNIALIPIQEIESLAVSLIDTIPSYISISSTSIEKTFFFTKFWLIKFPQLSNSQIIPHIVIQLNQLINTDDEQILGITINSYSEHREYFTQDQFDILLGTFLLKLTPLSDFEKAKNIKRLIIDAKEKISQNNRQVFLAQLLPSINSISSIRNEVSYNYWFELFDELIDSYLPGELDPLVLPNTVDNILASNYPEATNEDRSKFCKFIVRSFAKLSQLSQNNFFDIFTAFLSIMIKENAEYTIKIFHSLREFIKIDNFKSSTIELLINQFTTGINDSMVLKNIQIIYTCRDILTPLQIINSLQFFPTCVSENPKDSLEFISNNWTDFTSTNIFLTIKNLISARILENNVNTVTMLDKIKNDYPILTEENKISYLNELEDILKSNIAERDFFAKVIKITQSLNSDEFNIILKTDKIAEIKADKDIDLCRNKFSILIGIKGKDFEKDREMNDLFFLLLNDTIEKKKLAIDVFEYYYEEKHPFSRKVELTELFNNLLEVLDHEYKDTVKRLALKYDLKVKKSFFDGIFGN